MKRRGKEERIREKFNREEKGPSSISVIQGDAARPRLKKIETTYIHAHTYSIRHTGWQREPWLAAP